ncbi:unnamed protein product [Penicillium nalgiovense]|uniref:Uncharacterized protein n=1 Tax=Penicillium nalgiovense TaxID=60175 RepID=A0A9W4HNN2_PENNA|nr:unnamed protein product [Penicillium nalgiovense]CAG8043715.1 unnamed protein product [Penicillium nalgiovense]CAG8065030.1 unnamed protein product [Penicillium nalgiovense]CAG8067694.1 unnamed protein product [Penicillium nalgiovense]CAG8100875.1 unnamed protein product [Penicillium nalgiovense]
MRLMANGGHSAWSRCVDQSWMVARFMVALDGQDVKTNREIVTRFMVALDGQDVKTNRGWWPLWMVKM